MECLTFFWYWKIQLNTWISYLLSRKCTNVMKWNECNYQKLKKKLLSLKMEWQIPSNLRMHQPLLGLGKHLQNSYTLLGIFTKLYIFAFHTIGLWNGKPFQVLWDAWVKSYLQICLLSISNYSVLNMHVDNMTYIG